MKEITILETNLVTDYPPVISLIKILLNKGYKINFIGNGISKLEDDIKKNNNFYGFDIKSRFSSEMNFIKRIPARISMNRKTVKLVNECMTHSDILWTTSYEAVKTIKGTVLKYKHIMQFMELVDDGYVYKKIVKFPLVEYAKRAWKIVVCEKNRAYIHKAMWGLEKLPYVLPNKPFCFEPGDITDEMKKPLEIANNESRKIILYLGGIWGDRDLRPFASAIQKIGDYVLYLVGNAGPDEKSQLQLKELVEKYGAIHLGSFTAPKHLEFVKYAHIGLLSYSTVSGDIIGSINALYCAPNKIYEYAAFGKPMIGNDILGLKVPFEEYNIGMCCNENCIDSVSQCIKKIEENYGVMSANCKKFFDDTDLSIIVDSIINE